jgi:DNA-binding response OmpR family regulator
MTLKTIIIYKSPILFNILQEIKTKLNLNILDYDYEKVRKLNHIKKNYLILSNNDNQVKDCYIVKTPAKISYIIEKINLLFLAEKYSDQSKIKIDDYNLDLNSKKISKDNIFLKLTEKETKLITYLKMDKVVSLNELQDKVWGYSSELETHTVETHIYRLRKKFLEIFNDNEFIKHNKLGYYI